MELTLTVHVPRRRPLPVDVVVTWEGSQTAAGLALALEEHLGVSVHGLSVAGHPVPPATPVGSRPLLHGAAVSVEEHARARQDVPPHGTGSSSVLRLALVGGPDAGRSAVLEPPGLRVGRSVPGGLSLADDTLSRVHARFDVGSGGIVVADEESTNGALVDGVPISAPSRVDSSSTVALGNSTLRIRRAPGRGLPVEEDGRGRLLLQPPLLAQEPDDDIRVAAPAPPPERHRPRIPWLAALVPLPIALVLAWFLGPHLLAFALLGPVLMLGTSVGDRVGSGRAHRRDRAGYERDLTTTRELVERLVVTEAARLDRDHPDPHAVLTTAEHHLPGLWGRQDLRVRLGLGDVPSRVLWEGPDGPVRPLAHRAPVVLDLAAVGGVDVRGSPAAVHAFLSGVVGQLCVRVSPAHLRLNVASDHAEWSWVARLPHSCEIAATATAPSGAPSSGRKPEWPMGVLVVPELNAGVADVVAAARSSGWVVLTGSPGTSAHLPSDPRPARATVHLGAPSTLWVDGRAQDFAADRVHAWWTDRVSRAVAPLVPTGPTQDARRLPPEVGLLDLLGAGGLDERAVAARWERSRGRPAAPVGIGSTGVRHLDLVTDGPHVLVGGTTGSGKSEFLRTLVAGLAVTVPPDELALVLVDFKGGAAFGACTGLPHVAGVVTDLDAHVVDRALTALGAELKRRERLFAARGAADIDAYRRLRADAEVVPRLVVVVDELKALVQEVPHFVDGLVRLAAQGRSLGVHLVLATQRPAGAVSAEVQANVNLRIAFRMRDRTDSVDVLDDPAAADIDPTTPGRALAPVRRRHPAALPKRSREPAETGPRLVPVGADTVAGCRRRVADQRGRRP